MKCRIKLSMKDLSLDCLCHRLPPLSWGELALPTRSHVPVAGVSAGNTVAWGVWLEEDGRETALQGIRRTGERP